ncbi:MAG TPA: DNA-binding transcriptional regulator [Planctomycetota bacterium]|jgi:LacI family transcriptional regulator
MKHIKRAHNALPEKFQQGRLDSLPHVCIPRRLSYVNATVKIRARVKTLFPEPLRDAHGAAHFAGYTGSQQLTKAARATQGPGRLRQVAVVFPLQLDPTRHGSLEGQSLAQHQFKTMFSSYGILRGVCRFAHGHGRWNLRFSENSPGGLTRFIKQFQPEGIVAHVSSPEVRSILKRSGAKVVNVSSYMSDPGFPSVVMDNLAIGRLAATHLLDSGFRRTGFIGYPHVNFSELRRQGFVEQLQAHGQTPQNYPPVENVIGEMAYTAADKELCRWLRALVKPAGIFCCNDGLASCIADTCRAIGFRVPDDVALIGADNSEIVCELSNPQLSSVRIPRERVGFLAGEMLHHLMDGKPEPAEFMLLPPDGIALRRSSEILAVDDEDLVQALSYIREHAHESIGVEQVLAEVPISRRLLEQKFRDILGKSPLQEIQRVHIERAKQILYDTDHSLALIARQSGFNSTERLSVVFRQVVGMTPGQFRRRARMMR